MKTELVAYYKIMKMHFSQFIWNLMKTRFDLIIQDSE